MSISFFPPSNSSLVSIQPHCANITVISSISSAFIVTRFFLVVPVSIFILHLAFQQRRQQLAFKAGSHSDIFTYNQAALELIWILGTALEYLGTCLGHWFVTAAGGFLAGTVFMGESLFHILTCVDRYLAVVHPVAYRGLRHTRGVQIRNLSAVCAWLFSFLWSYIESSSSDLYVILFFLFVAFSLIIISFCSFSVLRALCGPGPGDGGGDRRLVDQTKKRAFFTILTIMGVLCFLFSVFLVTYALSTPQLLSERAICMLDSSLLWFSLPNSLILPLLYLNKTQKLPCRQRNKSRR